jgi:hypothetical protein
MGGIERARASGVRALRRPERGWPHEESITLEMGRIR